MYKWAWVSCSFLIFFSWVTRCHFSGISDVSPNDPLQRRRRHLHSGLSVASYQVGDTFANFCSSFSKLSLGTSRMRARRRTLSWSLVLIVLSPTTSQKWCFLSHLRSVHNIAKQIETNKDDLVFRASTWSTETDKWGDTGSLLGRGICCWQSPTEWKWQTSSGYPCGVASSESTLVRLSFINTPFIRN